MYVLFPPWVVSAGVLVLFRACLNSCNSRFLIANMNTSKQLSCGVCQCFKAPLYARLPIVNASRFCSRQAACCVLFVQGLVYPRKQVVHTFEKSSVAGPKAVSCLCLSEKRRVLKPQHLFVLPGLRHFSVEEWARLFSPGVLCKVFISCDERDPGLTPTISICL